MKKIIMSFFMMFFTFFFVSCGQPQISGSGGGGNHVEVIEFHYEYDHENGVFSFSNQEKGELVLVINGITYSIKENSFDVKSVVENNGEYGIYLYFYVDGSIHQKDYFIYNKIEMENGYIVSFVDEDGQYIKRLSLPSGYCLSMDDFPKYENVTGMTFSWDDLSYLNKPLDRSLEIRLLVDYEIFYVTYNLNGGTFEKDPITEYTLNSDYLELSIPSRDGYVFDGWYESQSFTGNEVVKFDILNPKNIEVYAKWIELSATAKELIGIINNSINQPLQTYYIKIDGRKSELALDFSKENIYVHSIERNDVIFVIEDNKYYDFSNNTFTKGNYTKDEYFDPLGLKDLINQSRKVTSSTKLGKKVYEVELDVDGQTLTLTVDDNLISKAKMTYGKESEEYSISYTCEKTSFDKSSFKEKKVATVYLIEIRDGIIPEDLCYYGQFDITGNTLNDVEDIKNMISSFSSMFGGMYLDKEMSNEINLDYKPQSSFDLYIVNYGRPEEAIEKYEFDLNVHCQCEECQDVKSYKDITIKDLAKVKHFEDFDGNIDKITNFHKVENGKIVIGWFISENKESEMFNGFNFTLQEHFNHGNYYQDLTIDLYTHIEYVETVLVREYCECDLHSNLGYVDNYYVKGNYYFPFNNSHKKDGYICNSIIVNNIEMPELELQEDVSIYLKWEKDTRITINLHSTFEGIKDTITAQEEEIYQLIKERYNGIFNDKYVLEGMYFDASFTKPVTKDSPIQNGCDIYLNFDLGNRVIFETIDGNTIEAFLPKSYNFDDVDWEKYAKLSYDSGFEERLGELVYRVSSHYEYMITFDFYSDKNLSNKVSILGDLNYIYLGYKEHPMVNIKCVDDCRHDHAPIYNNQIGWLDRHEHYDEATGLVGRIEFFMDEECTIEVSDNSYNYTLEDYTVYGKFIPRNIDFTIHCNCLNHPNGITGNFNSFDLAIMNCDYGYSRENGPSMEMIAYYLDPSFNERYWDGGSYMTEVELWVKTLGKVVVHCDCPLHNSSESFEIIALKDTEPHNSIKGYLSEYHHFAFSGAPIDIFIYINGDRNKVLEYDNYSLKENDHIYCEVHVDESFVPITAHYDDFVMTSYFPKEFPISLPNSYNNYKVVGYYLDKEFKNEVASSVGIYSFSIDYFDGLKEVYAKLVEAEKATFTYMSYEGIEVTSERYIFSEYDTVEAFYYMMRGKAGYLAYIIDENNNRCYPSDTLLPMNYSVYYEKTNDYVKVTVNCDCSETCYNGRYAQYMADDGTIRVVYEENIIYALKNVSCMREVYEGYGFHCNEYSCYDIYGANIYVNGVAVEDKSIFDYMYGMEMPPHLKDPFIFTEDAVIDIRFAG